ncbi:hypothetical protein E4U41_006973, partial [Claviceps citrina]
MAQSLRSILGRHRVSKPTTPRSRAAPPRTRTAAAAAAAPGENSKPHRAHGGDEKTWGGYEEDGDADMGRTLFPDRFADLGPASVLEEEPTLRDVVQAMRYIRSRMFGPLAVADRARVARYRASVPRLVTTGHVQA